MIDRYFDRSNMIVYLEDGVFKLRYVAYIRTNNAIETGSTNRIINENRI
jgi:hypothetical protein